MAVLIGNKPNQVPTNGDLGKMAFKDQVQTSDLYDASITTAKLSSDLQNIITNTVTNGVVTTGSYSNPAWITSINGGTY